MSLGVNTIEGKGIEANFRGVDPADGVQIGEYGFSLENFANMAVHFLGGGFFGFPGETPKTISDSLNYLFEKYEKVDGKWVRKQV